MSFLSFCLYVKNDAACRVDVILFVIMLMCLFFVFFCLGAFQLLKSAPLCGGILTRRIARNDVGGMIGHGEENERLWRGVYKTLVIKCLTRHAASLHANGVPFNF